MKVTGIIKKQNNFYYIRCNEGQFPITLITVSTRMLQASVNLTATATIDFARPSDREGFEFWLKEDLKIIHALLPYQNIMIKIIPATKAYKLHAEQWVNVYELGITGNAEFYDCCQVADLDLDDPSEYGLEIIEGEGKIMPILETLLEPQPTDAVLGGSEAAFQKWLSTAAVLGGTGESNK